MKIDLLLAEGLFLYLFMQGFNMDLMELAEKAMSYSTKMAEAFIAAIAEKLAASYAED